MKKVLGTLFALIAVVAVSIALVKPVESQAAKEFSTIKTVDKSETFTNGNNEIVATNYFTRVVLNGNSAAIKKINKTLNNASKRFFKEKSAIFEYAQITVDDGNEVRDEYFDCVAQAIEYVDDNYVSISEYGYWYAGGVGNEFATGYVFDLKTGNLVKKITKLTNAKSIKTVRKQIINAINDLDCEYETEEVKKMNATDFKFFINGNGDITVCFGAYELGFGGWSKLVTIPSKLTIQN